MIDLRTAAQQALEALEGGADSWQLVGPAIDALKAALAEPVQEPVWVCPDSAEHRYQKPGHCEDCGKTLVQEPATGQDDRTGECVCGEPTALNTVHRTDGPCYVAEPVQEPVAWRFQSSVGGWAYGSQPPVGSKYPVFPLYAAPPQRKPLTEEEIIDLWAGVSDPESPDISMIDFARAIERAHGIV